MTWSSSFCDALSLMDGCASVAGGSQFSGIANVLVALDLTARLRNDVRDFDDIKNPTREGFASHPAFQDFYDTSPDFDLGTALAYAVRVGLGTAGQDKPPFSLPRGNPRFYANYSPSDRQSYPMVTVPKAASGSTAVPTTDIVGVSDLMAAFGSVGFSSGILAAVAASRAIWQSHMDELGAIKAQAGARFRVDAIEPIAAGAAFPISDKQAAPLAPASSVTVPAGSHRVQVAGLARSDGTANPTPVSVRLVVDGATVTTVTLNRATTYPLDYLPIFIDVTASVVSSIALVNSSSNPEHAVLTMTLDAP